MNFNAEDLRSMFELGVAVGLGLFFLAVGPIAIVRREWQAWRRRSR